MERTFKRVTEKHIEEYLTPVIETYGHAILHGDGNIYVDKAGIEEKHQRSYIAKTYAGVGNEAAQYVIRFNSVNQIPETLDQLEKMFLDAKAKERFEDGKVLLNDDFMSIPANKKAPVAVNKDLEDENAKLRAEIEALKAGKKTAGRPPKEKDENADSATE